MRGPNCVYKNLEQAREKKFSLYPAFLARHEETSTSSQNARRWNPKAKSALAFAASAASVHVARSTVRTSACCAGSRARARHARLLRAQEPRRALNHDARGWRRRQLVAADANRMQLDMRARTCSLALDRRSTSRRCRRSAQTGVRLRVLLAAAQLFGSENRETAI